MPSELSELAQRIDRALSRGSKPAIQFHGVWYDWAWVRTVAERVNAMLDDAGIGPNDSIAIAPATAPASAAALIGLLWRQRDVVMMYPYQSPDSLARKIRDLNCGAVLLQASSWAEPTQAAVAEIGALGISLSEDDQAVVSGSRLDRQVAHRRAEGENSVNLLTSGTTGPPKLRSLSYEFVNRSMIVESAMHFYGTPPSETPYLFYHSFGNIAGLYSWLPHLESGRPVLMVEKFDFNQFLEYLAEWKPDFAGMPPAGFRQLIDNNIPREALQGATWMSGGASAFDADLQAEVQKRYGVTILQAYGATEFGGVVSAVWPEHIEQFGPEKAFSIGRPWAGSEFRIVDLETGEELPPNTPGEFQVRLPRLGPDWVRTSDICKVDEDGFLWYVGRSDGAIVRGGYKIDPDQVRDALRAHPALSDAIVAGVPDRRLGEVPVAAYVVKPGFEAPSVEELKAHMRARLPATFLPTAYKQVDVIPVTPTNKPNLAAVRAIFTSENA